MLDKLKKTIRGEFKRANLKSFVFFLGLSTVIWFFVQFSKHYTEVLTVPIKYQNYPNDKLINKDGSQLKLQVKQTGFQLVWFRLFKPTIYINLSALPADSTFLRFDIASHHGELVKELPSDFNNVQFLDNEIQIPFELQAVKKVPIASAIRVQFAPGYSSEEDIKLLPDSVKISGPEKLLDSVTKIYTTAINKQKVETDLNAVVRLKKPFDDVTLYHRKVNYSLEVEKFTEREISVPITVINAPSNAVISLYPSTVSIVFNVSLQRFYQIQRMDFEVVCDYNDIVENKNFLIPRIETKPDLIKNVRVFPQKIQYVIKK